ncbi:MAG: Proton/glutamate symporter [Candidatus Rifleibacterium amylolyticum]|nr:MAG: Proton/glutamate symporter [Candidatus Rifleibacterium amylolyticum]NLF97693.1 dicarboxylate/amino acid:cation symporter [Candidatus Riflebacteria bacterium]
MQDKTSLTLRILSGLALGAIAGIAMSYLPDHQGSVFTGLTSLFDLVGGLFINSIRMLVVPLVFVSLFCGVTNLGDIARIGRIGGKTLAFYLITTAIAISLALLVSTIVQPGQGLDMAELSKLEPSIAKRQSFVETLQNIIPVNPIAAMAEGNMLQIIFVALLSGVSATLVGARARPVIDFCESANAVVMHMVMLLMHLAPYGVFALIAKTFSTTGLDAMVPLIKYVLTVLAALLLHMCLVYMGALKLIGRLNPLKFFRNYLPAMSVGFSTASSNGTLPISIETVETRCGVANSIASFTMPLGATINMDGTAIMQGVAVVFIAQVYGIPLSLESFLIVILTATMASIGTAGVPGVGMITLSMVLESVNLPVEGIALIIGVDRLLDMTRTVVNITGDAVCTILIAKSEGKFKAEVYDSENSEKISFDSAG